jgi:hypothetical protein
VFEKDMAFKLREIFELLTAYVAPVPRLIIIPNFGGCIQPAVPRMLGKCSKEFLVHAAFGAGEDRDLWLYKVVIDCQAHPFAEAANT